MALAALGLFFGISAAPLRAQVIYSTGFEPAEGFDREMTLIGQSGWVGFGSGGNGLVNEFFEGGGQQAFIGFEPPGDTNSVLSVWRPLNVTNLAGGGIIRFSVRMQVADSTNERFDDFRWSVYNAQEQRLFTLDFDNSTLRISYVLDDDAGFVFTGLEFDNLGYYDLVISMDMGANSWTATLNETVIVNSQPITTTGASLTLGDIDAVWAIRNPEEPGDNYMLFDDYRVEFASSIAPTLETIGFVNDRFVVRVRGTAGTNYAVEVSSDLNDWQEAGVFRAPAGGTFDYEDESAALAGQRFYRVREAP